MAAGGVTSAEGAYRKLRLGASLVQLYTGLVYRGPRVVTEILRGLVDAAGARRARDGGGRRRQRRAVAVLLRTYRATGADLPFGRPERAHGVPFEGYYWRIVHPARGLVVVASARTATAGAW